MNNSVWGAAWDRLVARKEWDELEHPRGKTTDASTPGSFAPRYVAENKKVAEKISSLTRSSVEEYARLLQDANNRGKELSVRYSQNIESDLERGWSAWMGTWEKSKQAAVEQVADAKGIDLDEEFERRQDEFNSFKDLIDEKAEKWEVHQDPRSKAWAQIHHDGLAVFSVSDADSIDYYRKKNPMVTGNGDMTIGKIKVVGRLTEFDGSGAWYLLESDSTDTEPDYSQSSEWA